MIAEDEPGSLTLTVLPQDDGFYVVGRYGGRLRRRGTFTKGPFPHPTAAQECLRGLVNEQPDVEVIRAA